MRFPLPQFILFLRFADGESSSAPAVVHWTWVGLGESRSYSVRGGKGAEV